MKKEEEEEEEKKKNTPLRMCRGIGMYAYRRVTGISLVIMT